MGTVVKSDDDLWKIIACQVGEPLLRWRPVVGFGGSD